MVLEINGKLVSMGTGQLQVRLRGGTQMSGKANVAIIGSGNIGTDLMIKVMRTSHVLQTSALAGIDVNSDRLAPGPSASVCLPRTKDSKVSGESPFGPASTSFSAQRPPAA